MLLPEAAELAASMVKDRLEADGQVGKVSQEYTSLGSGTASALTLKNNIGLSPALEIGNIYAVTINGKKYKCECKSDTGTIDGYSYDRYIGNLDFSELVNDTGVPFKVLNSGGNRKHVAYSADPTTGDYSVDRTITVELVTETIHPSDPKFLPDTVATKADIFGAMEASY